MWVIFVDAKCTVSDDEHLASDGDSEGGEMEAEPNTSEPSKPRGIIRCVYTDYYVLCYLYSTHRCR